jgi:hypothetical protein
MFDFTFPHWPGHTIALGLIVGWVSGVLPSLATLASLIYFLFQIYHDQTVQDWLHAWAIGRQERKLARLLARQKLSEEKIVALELKRHQRAEAATAVAVAKATAATLVAATITPIL